MPDVSLADLRTQSAAAEPAVKALTSAVTGLSGGLSTMARGARDATSALAAYGAAQQSLLQTAGILSKAQLDAGAAARRQADNVVYLDTAHRQVATSATGAATAVRKMGSDAKLSASQIAGLASSTVDLASGLASGTQPLETTLKQVIGLAGGLGEVFAGLEVGGAAAVGIIAPWIAGLVAVGGAIYLVVQQHEQHKRKNEELTKNISEMTNELQKSVPSLVDHATSANLAATGAQNFESWLDKNSQSLSSYADRLKTATVNQYMLAAAQAATAANELRDENTRKTPRALVYTGGGGAEGLQKYLEKQAQADQNVKVAEARAKAALDAPSSAFTSHTGGSAPQDNSASAIDAAVKAELAARQALTQNIEQIANFKKTEADQEAAAAKRSLKDQVKSGSITADAAKAAGTFYDDAALAKKKLIDQQTAAAQVEREITQRTAVAGFVERTAASQAAMASSTEERNRIEAVSLQAKQALEANALTKRTEQQVLTGQITDAYRTELLKAQAEAQGAEREAADRAARVLLNAEKFSVVAADIDLQKSVLSAEAGASKSATERRVIGERVLKLDQDLERRKLEQITVANGANATEVQIAQDRLAALGKIQTLARMSPQDKLQAAYNEHLDAVNAMTNAFKDKDWNALALSLQAGFKNLQVAFSDAGTAMDKVGALAGVAAGLGAAIGGKAGAALSGAANGAMAGMSLGGAPGAAIGAALGGLTSFLGASAAKAEAKLEALRKSQADFQAAQLVSSNSIVLSLGEASNYQNKDLQYSNDMLRALRSIDNQIDAVAVSLASQISGGSLLSTSGLGLGSTSSKGGASGGILGGLVSGAAGFGLASLAIGGIVTAFAAPIALVAGALGLLVGALSKTKTTTELLDQGLQFSAATLAQVNGGGLQGQTYADLVSTTKKSVLGINYSTKVRSSTQMAALDPAAVDQISGVISALGSAVQIAASQFGEAAGKAAQTALEGATIDLGKLSLKGLTAEEIEKVLNATFAKVGDDLAKTATPGLEQLQNLGEGALQTLVRLATEYRTVDDALASIGKTFGAVGLASLAARDNFVEMMGGLDALVGQTSFFAENFLTDAERLAPTQASVTAEMASLGKSSVTTKDQFKDLVVGLDLSVAANQGLFNALMKVAPAFAKVADAAEAAGTAVGDRRVSIQDETDKLTLEPVELIRKQRQAEMAATIKLDASLGPLLQHFYDLSDAADAAAAKQERVEKARSVLTEAYERESAVLQATSDRYKAFATTLRDYRLGLDTGSASMLSPEAKYLADKAEFERTAALAKLGNEDALGDLQAVSEAYRTSSQDYYGSSLAYFQDLAGIKEAVSAAESTATRTSSIADQQLSILRASVGGLITLDTSVISVRDAILGLYAAMDVTPPAGVTSPGGSAAGQPVNPVVPGGYATDQSSNNAVKDGVFIPGDIYDPDFHDDLRRKLDAQAAAEAAKSQAQKAAEQAAIEAEGLAWLDSVWGGYPGAYNDAQQRMRDRTGLPGFATGGSFVINGNYGVDQNTLSINGSPVARVGRGETVSVSPNGDDQTVLLREVVRKLGDVINELRADKNQRGAVSNASIDRLDKVIDGLVANKRATRQAA